MAIATLMIGGRRYEMACREGEQEHLESLGTLIDAKATQAAKAVGGLSETRQLLLAAILLADDLNDARNADDGGAPVGLAAAIEALAQRLETLAARFETGGLEKAAHRP